MLAGLTQWQLAARSGVGELTVHQLETGRRRAASASWAVLSLALGIPRDILAYCAPTDPEAAEWAARLRSVRAARASRLLET